MAQAKVNIGTAMGFARAAGRRPGGNGMRAFSVVLMAVFFVVLMLGLVAGVSMYRAIAEAQARANDLDMQSGIVASAVHAGDAHDALQRGEGPEGDALVLVDTVGGEVYETRIYLYEGKVVQEYALADREYSPRDANELLDADSFGFDVDGGLVTMRIGERTFDLYVRSAQDGTSVGAAGPEAAGARSDGGSGRGERIDDGPAIGAGNGGAS